MLKQIITDLILRKLSFFLTVAALIPVFVTFLVGGRQPADAAQLSQFFYLGLVMVFLTLTNGLRAWVSRVDRLQFNLGDLLALVLWGYLSLSFVLTRQATSLVWWDTAIGFTLYVNLRLFVAVEKGKSVGALVWLVLLLGLVEECVAFVQLFGRFGGQGVAGTLHDPAALGALLAVVMTVALYAVLYYYPRTRKEWNKHGIKSLTGEQGRMLLLSAGCLALGLIILPATESRGAWLGAALGLAGVLWYAGTGDRVGVWIEHHRRRAMIAAGVLLCVVAGLILLASHLCQAPQPEPAAGWHTSLRTAFKHGLVGGGLGRYWLAYGYEMLPAPADPADSALSASYTGTFNSDYLQGVAETGLIGLALFGALMFVAFRGYIRYSFSGRGLPFALAALLIAALLAVPLQSVTLRMLLVVLLAAGVSVWRTERCTAALRWQALVLVGFTLLLNLLFLVRVFPHRKHDIQQRPWVYGTHITTLPRESQEFHGASETAALIP